MKRKHYIWIAAILLYLLFGGRYVRDYKAYQRTEKFERLNEETIVYTSVNSHHTKKRYFIFYWSDVFTAPYELDFVVEKKTSTDQKVQLHQVTMRYKEQEHRLHQSSPEDPLEVGFNKKKTYKAYEAVKPFPLGDLLPFDDEGFEVRVLWSFSNEQEMREYHIQYEPASEYYKTTIWSVLRSI